MSVERTAIEPDCATCIYSQVFEAMFEGFSRIDAIRAITSSIEILEIGDRDLCTQAAIVAVDTVVRVFNQAKASGKYFIPAGSEPESEAAESGEQAETE